MQKKTEIQAAANSASMRVMEQRPSKNNEASPKSQMSRVNKNIDFT